MTVGLRDNGSVLKRDTDDSVLTKDDSVLKSAKE